MQASVIALEERIKVYNEFLKGEMSGIEVSEDSSEEIDNKKSRAPRSTKAEMERRKIALQEIFTEKGNFPSKSMEEFHKMPRSILMRKPLDRHGEVSIVEIIKLWIRKRG